MRKLLTVTAGACAVVLMAAPVAADEEEDQAIADESVLTLADLPEGWVEGDAADDDDPAEGEIPACEAIERTIDRGDEAPHAESPDFDDTNDPNAVTSVSNEVIVFPKAKGAKRYLKPFETDGEACLRGRGGTAPGALDVQVQELDVQGSGVGYTVLVTVESNGEQRTQAVDIVVVRVGRAITNFAAENVDEPLPEGPDILDAVLGRLQESL
ncbi:MAG: hypothetical protein ACRDY6_07515 [Acidimicrobiia bacterium]